MIFGIDYHGTFSRDPNAFTMLVKTLQSYGHECILVTGIEDSNDWHANEVKHAVRGLMPVVFAGGAWKREVTERAGLHIDVWIDDNPEYIAPQDPRRCVLARQMEKS